MDCNKLIDNLMSRPQCLDIVVLTQDCEHFFNVDVVRIYKVRIDRAKSMEVGIKTIGMYCGVLSLSSVIVH